ncbi:MAG: hypothetical protein BGO67_11985 [Alphaproteobacteria bacterium 41-28]|nr:MAG: hypothetical protein BGO67_11985 [Alphaproteobacteria bacterium 41-28]
MKAKAFISVILSVWGNELFAYPSLFFTEEDIKSIREDQLDEQPHSLNLHLSALLYIDQNHWSMWINHKIIRPETCHDIDGFHLEGVTAYGATFSRISSESLIPRTFTLRPFQTYIAREQKVVDEIKNECKL